MCCSCPSGAAPGVWGTCDRHQQPGRAQGCSFPPMLPGHQRDHSTTAKGRRKGCLCVCVCVSSGLRQYASGYFRMYVLVRLFEEGIPRAWMGRLAVHPLGRGGKGMGGVCVCVCV